MELVNKILGGICFYVLMWNAYILIFNRGVPNIHTAPVVRRKMVEILKKDKADRKLDHYRVFDMGSGNGYLSKHVAQNMPEAEVIGLDICKIALGRARMAAKRAKLPNLEYREEDFFKYDLSEADAVILYLSIYEMGRVGEKLMKELKPGTIILCNRFALGGGWEPVEVVPIKKNFTLQKKLHVYRKK